MDFQWNLPLQDATGLANSVARDDTTNRVHLSYEILHLLYDLIVCRIA